MKREIQGLHRIREPPERARPRRVWATLCKGRHSRAFLVDGFALEVKHDPVAAILAGEDFDALILLAMSRLLSE